MANNIKKIKIIYLIAIIVLLSNSCGKSSFKSDEDLLVYLQDESNGYLHKKNKNGFDFSLMYRPTDLIINQESTSSTSKLYVDSLRSKYDNYLYFNLGLSKDNREVLNKVPKNRNDFSQLSNLLLFGMSDKVYLYTQDNDTIDMIDYIYPRMYGAGHSTDMMFIYPRDSDFEKSEQLNFVIKDIGIGTGEIKFVLETKKIKNQPTIEFKIRD